MPAKSPRARLFFTSLQMRGWRNFKGPVDMHLRRRVFLIGPNASGKSNISNETLSLWERVAEGRVRVLSYAMALNSPHPTLSQRERENGSRPPSPKGKRELPVKSSCNHKIMAKSKLTVDALKTEAGTFAVAESTHREPTLFGVTDGKAIGTYFEHKFRGHLRKRFDFAEGSSAKGIDFPDLGVDVKVTSVKQPQSSCPYESARQKIFGLGYSILVFAYDKTDDPATQTGQLNVRHAIFIEKRADGRFSDDDGHSQDTRKSRKQG